MVKREQWMILREGPNNDIEIFLHYSKRLDFVQITCSKNVFKMFKNQGQCCGLAV